MNLAAVQDLCQRFADFDLVFVESGGDNLSATFSPELVDHEDYHSRQEAKQSVFEYIEVFYNRR